MSSANPTHKTETEDKNASEVEELETTTGRLIIFNRGNAKERISSRLTVDVEP